ncbi:MAG: protein-glutamate O-methyltransferase CheR [Acidaminococcales bacterium]|nr:protein-glutamate O-methyltransferase CheR [Acidaminococcales bacterium]
MSWQEDKNWESFKEKWLRKSGIDLNLYKPAQMHRRINNFMERAGTDSYDKFLEMVSADKDLYHAFFEHLTINVTEFFRTPEKFDDLEKIIIPELLKKSSKLRIWSAGCSTGAEPYSLAMMLNDLTPGVSHRILATDLDVEMLAKAKAGGPYNPNEVKNLPPARIKNYFTKVNDGYMVNDAIKHKIELKQHNLLKDRFETGFNLILCRNVVIYFTEEAKDKLYRNFFAALKEGGILFVGGTEAIMNFRDMGYTQIRPFFYQKH